MSCWRSTVVALVMLATLPGVGSAQGFKWWQSDRFKAELALTDDQTARLEAVYQDLLPRMTAGKEELDGLEKRLSEVIRDATAAEADVMKQVDLVEAARSALGKNRTLMIYRMHRILSPEQRAKMKDLRDKWMAERRESRRHQ